MSNDGVVLDGDAIKRLVTEVADELAGNEQRTIVVVGGSLLAWHVAALNQARRIDCGGKDVG